jgi:hypothetical protein
MMVMDDKYENEKTRGQNGYQEKRFFKLISLVGSSRRK